VKDWRLRLQASLAELTPEQVAAVVSIGLVLGVFPISGFPTVFCLLAALGFRLNPAALQVMNQISTPLQLALMLPLARAGGRLCGGAASGGSWMGQISSLALDAVAGWTSICIPLGALLYICLLIALRRCRFAATL
jgi:uncharacterized protein (DUF2062 family)